MSTKWQFRKVALLEVLDTGVFGQILLEGLPEVADENVLAKDEEFNAKTQKWLQAVLHFIGSAFDRGPIIGNFFLGPKDK